MTCVDRDIDVGLDVFLELNGSTYWCGESEVQAAKNMLKMWLKKLERFSNG